MFCNIFQCSFALQRYHRQNVYRGKPSTKCNIDLIKEIRVIYYNFNKNMPNIYAVDVNTGIFFIKKDKNVHKDA